jgi:hypothetical protein
MNGQGNANGIDFLSVQTLNNLNLAQLFIGWPFSSYSNNFKFH